ncbi:ABC transporter permease [Alkanindiges sp. WGS2144]|uniref:ABC transporter permease n=1 Tax=Alkanindiges sp. WGS2144 TaxID=3366808 RepID=UPI003750AEA0
MGLFILMLRQSRAGRGIWVLLVALILAVTSTTALRFTTDSLRIAINQQAGQMLAGDLVLSSNQPIDTIWQQRAEKLQLSTNSALVFSSMAQAGEQFVLVNVKAVDAGFPLRGELNVQPVVGSQGVPERQTVWLSPRLFDLLNVKNGDQVRIGDASFKVAAAITRDPNQETGMSGFSPTVIIHQADVAATQAVQVGSRIDYRLMLTGTAQQVAAFQKAYEGKLAQGMQLRVASQGNTRLMRPIRLLEDYAHIASIMTMLLCGVAIALACQRYVNEQLDHFAMLRCLGASHRQLSAVYAGLLLLLLGAASLSGMLAGAAVAYGILKILQHALPALELAFQPVLLLGKPLLTGIFTATVLLLGFALPDLLRLIYASPLRVIRRIDARNGWIKIFIAGSAFTALLVFLLVQTGKPGLSLSLLLGLLVVFGVLYLVVLSGLWLLRHTTWGQLYIREPKQMGLQILALSLGLGLLSILLFLRHDLMQRWQHSLPPGTPNQFVYGLPPDQKDDFVQRLQQQQWQGTPLYPNIKGRLVAKNSQPFSAEQIKQHNSLRRELNLTQSSQFPVDNSVLSGKLFNGKNQVSVEQKTAENLNIQLGDTLSMSLPEGNMNAKVVSIRSVNWDSFSPNFFFIYSPGSMDEFAGSYLGSFYVPPGQQHQLAQVIADFPTTVFIDVEMILNEVRRLMAVLGQALTLLAVLVSLAGVLVLLASLQLLVDQRKPEVVLLRVIGLSRSQLRQRLTVEMGLIGIMAGMMAVVLAQSIAALMAWRLNIPFTLHIMWWIVLPLLMLVLAVLIGQYRLRPLWNTSPLIILRRE